jgi:hypothetical protein
MTRAKTQDAASSRKGTPYPGIPGMKIITPDGKRYATGAIRWGEKHWRIVAPALQKHAQQHGLRGMAAAMDKAQRKLPHEWRRNPDSFSVLCSPSTQKRFHLLAVIAYFAQKPATVPEAVPAPASASAPIERIAKHDDECPGLAAAQELLEELKTKSTSKKTLKSAKTSEINAKSSPPDNAPLLSASNAPLLSASKSDELAAVSKLPLSVFVTPLKELFVELIGAAMREQIASVVRATVEDVIGAPAPSAQPAPPSELTPSEPPAEPEISTSSAPSAELSASEQRATDTAHDQAQRVNDQNERDWRDALQSAAKNLGLNVPDPRRESVVVVGMHPKVEQELERRAGAVVRLIFKRPDAFNCAKDLPATTDAVLLCRKKLTHELTTTMRRYNLPHTQVMNTSDAAIAAIGALLPELRAPLRDRASPAVHH